MCYTTEIKEQELAKYATAVAASPDGVAVGEDGAPVEEEEKDEVPRELLPFASRARGRAMGGRTA